MPAFLAGLKKAGAFLAKNVGKKLISGMGKAVSKGVNSINPANKNRSVKQSGQNVSKRRGTMQSIISLILCFAVLLFGVVLMSGMFMVTIACMPLVALIGLIYSVFYGTGEVQGIINEYWDKYQYAYGTVSECEAATDAEILDFLLNYDDFWEEADEYFKFDQETMHCICQASYEDGYYAIEAIEVECKSFMEGSPNSLNTSEEQGVYASTSYYVNVGDYTLSWQQLYAILAGSTDSEVESIEAERIDAVVDGLSPSNEDIRLIQSLLMNKNVNIENDGSLQGVQEFEVRKETVAGKSYIYQVIGDVVQTGEDATVFYYLSEEGNLQSRLVSKLEVEYSVPLYEPRNTTLDVWNGVVVFDESGEVESFTPSSERLETVLIQEGFSLRPQDAVTYMLELPGGYFEAAKLSELISDGTVAPPEKMRTQIAVLLSEFSGQGAFLQEVLTALEIDIDNLGLPNGANGDYSQYVDTGNYVILESVYEDGPDVVWWSQLWYTNSYYGRSLISSNGCGPSSLAIVYSSLTGDIKSPAYMAAWCYENGYHSTQGNNTVGTASIFNAGARDLGLRVDYVGYGPDAFREAIPYLEQGDLIVCNVGRNARGNPIFSGQGHFLVVRGVTSDGKVLLADPGKCSNRNNLNAITNTTYEISDMEYILDRTSVGNTGKVWAIGYDGVRKDIGSGE